MGKSIDNNMFYLANSSRNNDLFVKSSMNTISPVSMRRLATMAIVGPAGRDGEF